MRYIHYTEIRDDVRNSYFLIGYRNPSGQLDVARLYPTLISGYYLTQDDLDDLSGRVDSLSNFLMSCLEFLSSDRSGMGNKIIVPELSSYCTKARFNEMREERTFIDMDDFMKYLQNTFKTNVEVHDKTKLKDVGNPLIIARGKIENMFEEAYKEKEEKD